MRTLPLVLAVTLALILLGPPTRAEDDQAQLTAIRAERDALAARVRELEQRLKHLQMNARERENLWLRWLGRQDYRRNLETNSNTDKILQCNVTSSTHDDGTARVRGTYIYTRRPTMRHPVANVQHGVWTLTYVKENELWETKRTSVTTTFAFPTPPPVHLKVVTGENAFDVLLNGQKVAEIHDGELRDGELRDTNIGHFRKLLKRWQDARVPLDAVPAIVELGKDVPVVYNAHIAQMWLLLEGLKTIEFKVPVKRPRPPAKDR